MIGGNLYPIYQSFATGFLSTDEYMQEISTNVNGNNYSDKMAGYYLGWARPQNLPDAWKFTRPHAVTYAFSDADYGRLEDYRDLPRLSLDPIGNAEQNSDIGYGISGVFSYTGSYWNTYSSENATGNKETGEHNDFGTNSNAVNNLGGTYGINNIYPEFWGITTVTLRFIVFFSNPLDEPLEVRNNFTISNMTIPQYRLFKDGSLSYTFNEGVYGNVVVTGTDFQEGKANVESSIGNKAIVIFTGVFWQNTYMYRGSPNQTAWTPGVIVHDKTVFKFFGSAINTGDERFVVYNSAGYENSAPYYLQNLASMGVAYNGNGYTVGCGKELNLTIGDIIDIPNNHWTERYDGFIISRGYGGVAGGISIYPYYDISMVEKVLGFLPKVMQNNSVPSYANLNFAPLVSASDEFMGSLHTGNTNDPAFKNKLRRWQYIDPENPDPENNGTENANTYDATDPDSKPDFDPDYDPGGGGEEGGDDPSEDPEQLDPGDIIPATREDSGSVEFNLGGPSSLNNGFITQYALTSAEVDGIGATLWSTLRNPSSSNFVDMVRNFYTIGDELDPTFYLTNSDIIDYFISLRCYPFRLSQFPGYSNITPIKVGSGACSLGTNGRILNRNVGYIPGGSCSIPAATGFYDYEPYVSIVVYVPFCGTVELQPSQVRGKTIFIDYYVDFFTGGCTAYIKVSLKGGGSYPITTVNGTLGFDILMTSNNANTVAARTQASNNNTRINMIETLGGGIMSGISGLITAGKTRGGEEEILKEAAKDVGKSIFDAGMQSIKHVTNQPLLMGLSPMTSGNFYDVSSLGYIKPFVQIKHHPQWNKGANYSMVGYVASKKMQVSAIKNGTFFTCINPQLKGIKCTAREAEMIKAHLTAGCYK